MKMLPECMPSTLPTKIEPDDNTISNIVSLPQELLELIFDMAQGDRVTTWPDGTIQTPYLDDIPVIASHVCRHWRSMVLENPLWWSFIVVTPPWNIEKIELYLKRSKQCLLDLRIFVHLNYLLVANEYEEESALPSLPSLDNFERVCELIAPHYARCRRIQIQGVFNKEKDLAFRLGDPLSDADLPYLEEFIFDAEIQEYRHYPHNHKRFFASAPRLRDLRLGGIGLLNYSPPPMSFVTTLHLSRGMDEGHLTFNKLGEILASCPCLTSLAVYDDLLSRSSFDTDNITRCSVPTLENLHIFGNMLKVSEILMFLAAPKLRGLIIAPFATGDLTLLLSYPLASKEHSTRFPLLKSLTLAPAHPEAFGALRGASACFPQVERLVLANMYAQGFREMFIDIGEESIFPNLVELALTAVAEGDIGIVTAVHHVRQLQKVPLRTIFVDKATMKKLPLVDRPNNIQIVEEDIWESQRTNALYSHIDDLFVGRTTSDDNL